MTTCKAIIQVGPRKGLECQRSVPCTENNYCDRHQRNKLYDEGIAEGTRWCRFFFRGCSNNLNDQPAAIRSCADCREKKRTNPNCQHEGCSDQAMTSEIFCGRHIRDKYRLEEVEKGIRYCDIARGCFNLCQDGLASCTECLEKEAAKTKERYDKRRDQNNILITVNTNMRICIKCGRDFEKYGSTKCTDVQKCPPCFEMQLRVEASRETRSRNYKAERFTNLKTYYSAYIHNAITRNKEIPLQFDDFCSIVVQPCYYCNYYKEDEVNGIDRLNNDIGYDKSNCVPCCEVCNRMKSFYHPSFFIQKAKIMCGLIEGTKDFYDKWKIYYSRSINHQYNAYKNEAIKRSLPFNLSESEFTNIIMKPCYLCGYKQRQGIGIDRFDNTIREYNVANCKPCCGSCNNAKADFDYITFMERCTAIAKKWPDSSVFDAIPVPRNPSKKSHTDNSANKKQWRAKTLCNAILSDTISEYYDQNKDLVSMDELNLLSDKVKLLDENGRIEILMTFINTVNKRRTRQKEKKITHTPSN